MAENLKAQKRQGFPRWLIAVFWLAMIIFACHASTRMVAAGDTWVAMACGRHFINHGVDTVEPFSANSHRSGPTEEDLKKWPKWITKTFDIETIKYWHPTGWVNQNWLTHVIFYWLTHLSPFADAENLSFNTLVYWKVALYLITVFCLYFTARIFGANAFLATGFACFAMFVGRSFLDVRPAGFSNMLVALYLLTLALTAYRNIHYIWLIVPMVVFWCNVHGGYLYAFVAIVPFVALHFLASFFPKRFVSVGLKNLYHVVAAAIIAFVAMIIFNPFHLTNLTHTFVISFSKHAELWRSVNEWHPAFEWKNPVGTSVPFLIMYIISWIVLVVWAVTVIAKPKLGKKAERKQDKLIAGQYQWPKIDLALLVIAAITIYMAIRSRRFIPIAAYAVCPVLAMLTQQIICMISARINFKKQNKLAVSPLPAIVSKIVSVFVVVFTLSFGIWFSAKFYHVYLGPWPGDPKFDSVFMRMTASYAKPFRASQFIRENKIEGKMLNYWTEGGFIAYGQIPDPNTGKTPLQLFMDGRAQAAYEPSAYYLWTGIMAGGRHAYRIRTLLKRPFKKSDYIEIGKGLDEQLKKHNVWVAMMPLKEFESTFVKGIENTPNWQIIFINNKQKIFVDVDTKRGKELYLGIFNGKTIFSDEFSKNLTLAYNKTRLRASHLVTQGLEHAIKAFELYPSHMPVAIIVTASRIPELRPKVASYCRNYFEDFMKNKHIYSKQPSYGDRIAAMGITARFLANIYRNDPKQAAFYKQKEQEYKREHHRLVKQVRW